MNHIFFKYRTEFITKSQSEIKEFFKIELDKYFNDHEINSKSMSELLFLINNVFLMSRNVNTNVDEILDLNKFFSDYILNLYNKIPKRGFKFYKGQIRI